VRRSTPAHKHRVANVALNLCSQKLSGSSFARSATALTQSRKSSFGLQPAVGKSRLQPWSDFAFHAFKGLTSFFGMGISRSLYALGVQFQSGLWLTRTVPTFSHLLARVFNSVVVFRRTPRTLLFSRIEGCIKNRLTDSQPRRWIRAA
jgi:hypothetical protein